MKRNHEAKISDYSISFQALNQIYNDELKKISELMEKHMADFQKHTEKFDSHASKTEDKLDALLLEFRALSKSRKTELLEVKDLPEFETIKELRGSNKHEAVLLLIKDLKDRKWEQLSSDTKFKLLINEGLTLLDLGKDKLAAENFLSALPLASNNENALSYAAVGYQILGQPDKARVYIEKTLAISPSNINAYNTLIQLRQNEDYNLLKTAIPTGMLEVPEISYNLAIVAKRHGNFEEAIELLQNTVDNSKKENPVFFGTLGSTILESITSNPFPYVTEQIGAETKTKVNYSIKMISRSWEKYDQTDLKEKHSYLLIHRSIAKKMLKDMDGAFEDALKAISILPSDPYITRYLMITYIELRKSDIALETCEKLISLAESEEKIEALVFKAQILQQLNRHQESLDILLETPQSSLSAMVKKLVRHLIITAYSALEKFGAAIAFLEELIAKETNEIQPQLESANFYWQHNGKEKAEGHLESAYKLVRDDSPPDELLELANFYYKAQSFEKAALLYEKITDKKVYSSLTKKLIRSYFNSGHRKKALDICLDIEKLYGLDQYLADGICMIYESADDINNAIEACNRYLAINPDDQVIIIRLAFLYDRLELRDKLAETLEKVSAIDYTVSYKHLYRLASVYCKNGQDEKGFNIAYETRRANYNNGEAHLQYFGLNNEFKSEMDAHTLPMVTVHSTVKIEDEGGSSLHYTIEDRVDVLAERGELNILDPIAKLLLGKKIGESVILDKGRFGQQVFIVKEIVTRYLFACQETIRLFSTRFINQPGIAVVHMATGDTPQERLAPIFKMLDAEEPAENQLNQLYRNSQATIGIISSIRKRNPIRAFFVLSEDPTLGIYPVWHINELANSKADIDSRCPVVLDITSLVILAATDSLFLLERLPNKKVISQTTYDTITDLLRELRMSSQGMMTIGKVKGEYVKQVVSPDQIVASIAYYEKLEKWVKDNSEIRSSSSILTMKTSEAEESRDLFGASFHDSVLVAKELKGVLLSDDNVLRQLASSEHSVKGIHTFLLSIYMLEKKLVSNEEHNDLILKLFSFNFKNLPCGVGMLVEASKRSKYQPAVPFSKVVEGLASPLLPEKLATITAITFLYEIYSDSGLQIYSTFPLETIRLNLAVPVLNALFQRPIDLKHLAQVLHYKFNLLPKQKDELIKIINDLLRT